MQQLLKVLAVAVPAGLCLTLAGPLAADDRIALVGCDLTDKDGPTAIFLQISGEHHDGPGIAIDGNKNSNSDNDSKDVAGRSCARVLADLVDDGFAFRGADAAGRSLNQWVSIWQSGD